MKVKKFIYIMAFPIKWFFLGLIYIYKILISPMIPHTCRFTPSCSSYMVQAIREFGSFKGILLGMKRLFRCVPGSKGGYDPIPPNIKGELKWLL